MTSTADPGPDDSLSGQAIRWFRMNRDTGLSELQRREFLDWLKLSPEHVREYLKVLWMDGEIARAVDVQDLLPRPAAAFAQDRGKPGRKVVPLRQSAIPVSGWRGGGRGVAAKRGAAPRRRALAICLLLAGALGLGLGMPEWSDSVDYATAQGQQRSIALPDRTRVRLNADSAIRVRMSWNRRQLELIRGEMAVTVAPERRRFEVMTSDLRIRDIGTTFDVSRRSQATRVGVVEGAVEVWARGGTGEDRLLAHLTAGQTVDVLSADHRVRALDRPIEMLLAWQRRQLAFRDEELGEIVRELNRYNKVQVVVDDPAAASRRFSGVLNAEQLEVFVDYLKRNSEFVVRRDADTLHVSTR